ncbi:MAG: LacI family transcriptional regulator [Treponema sp.]|jgi:LacI family transcriptional regulator|nr:LacI family transcriptional regulator [Treponema sp.]
MKKKAVLKDVAVKSGVSKSTVSLVIRKSNLVSEVTRQKVLRAIEETGYVYNRGAASLRTRFTRTIGLIMVDIDNPFYAGVFHGMEDVLDKAGFSLLTAITSDKAEKQSRIYQTMLEQNVDGIFLCPCAGTTQDTLKKLRNSGVPYVLFARYLANFTMDYVGVDNLLGAKIAVEYLIEKGHQKIAFVACRTESSILTERLQGYCSTMEAHKLSTSGLQISCPMTFDGGKQAALKLFGGSARPTAIVCYNDIIAYGVMLGAAQLKMRPGRDIAIIGADDSPIGAYCSPGITTISTRPVEVGAEAAKLLLDRLEDGEGKYKRILLTPQLIERGSG